MNPETQAPDSITLPLSWVPWNSPILREPCPPVTSIVSQVAPLVHVLREFLMLYPNCASFAAPQVGIALRFFVTGLEGLPGLAINPEILERSHETTSALEGCMSFSEGRRKTYIRRNDWIVSHWLDLDGVARTQRFRGWAARVFQHELDHLEGICIFP